MAGGGGARIGSTTRNKQQAFSGSRSSLFLFVALLTCYYGFYLNFFLVFLLLLLMLLLLLLLLLLSPVL